MPILSPTTKKTLPSALIELTGGLSVDSDKIYLLALALKKCGISTELENDLFVFTALTIGAHMFVRRMLHRVIRRFDDRQEIFSPEERVKLLDFLGALDDNLPDETTEE